MAPEQKGCRHRSFGAKDQLLINKPLTENCKTSSVLPRISQRRGGVGEAKWKRTYGRVVSKRERGHLSGVPDFAVSNVGCLCLV